MHDLFANATPMTGSFLRLFLKTVPDLVKDEMKGLRWLEDQDNPDAEILENERFSHAFDRLRFPLRRKITNVSGPTNAVISNTLSMTTEKIEMNASIIREENYSKDRRSTSSIIDPCL
jgi:hypothetical protein